MSSNPIESTVSRRALVRDWILPTPYTSSSSLLLEAKLLPSATRVYDEPGISRRRQGTFAEQIASEMKSGLFALPDSVSYGGRAARLRTVGFWLRETVRHPRGSCSARAIWQYPARARRLVIGGSGGRGWSPSSCNWPSPRARRRDPPTAGSEELAKRFAASVLSKSSLYQSLNRSRASQTVLIRRPRLEPSNVLGTRRGT